MERGDLEEADSLLERVAEVFRSLGQASMCLECALVRAEGQLRAGRPDAALEGVGQAAEGAGEDAVFLAPQVAYAQARALGALGRHQDAEQELEAGLTSARDQGLRYEEGMLLLARAEIARMQGQPPDSGDLEAAAEILAGLGVPRDPSWDAIGTSSPA